MKEKSKKHKTSWAINDLVDLEYFMHQDRLLPEAQLDQRDRNTFIAHIEPVLKTHPPAPGDLNKTAIRIWLSQRRRQEEETGESDILFPGEVFSEGYRGMRLFLGIAGIFIGSGLALALLQYSGAEPINVAVYWGSFVFIQILWLIAACLVMGFKATGRRGVSLSPSYRVLFAALTRLMEKGGRWMMQHVAPERKNSIMAAIGRVKGSQKVPEVFYWPLFILAQIFGIGLNIGIIAATLIRVIASDLAFGWQSTLHVSPQFISYGVRVMAFPWRWIMEAPPAYPSISQIEGSRMILKDGISRLGNQDLTAWWPFLCLCVVFYGLLPRLFLLSAAMGMHKKAINRFDFSDAKSDVIMTRLLTPLVRSAGQHAEEACDSSHPPAFNDDGSLKVISSRPGRCIALIPEDIFDENASGTLRTHFRFLTHGIEPVKITLDLEQDKSVFDRLEKEYQEGMLTHVLLVFEGWQPPITETLGYVRNIRKLLGDHFLLYIGLVGEPGAGNRFSPVDDARWNTWRQKIAALNDPYIRLERITPHAG